MVEEEQVDLNAALKAQDASNDDDGNPNLEVAVKLAQEMAPMTGVQRKKVIEDRREHPERSVDEVIERAKASSKVVQIVATVTQGTHVALQRFAREEGTNQNEAAAGLIEEALVGRGLLDE